MPSAGATTSVRPRRQLSSRRCASICAFSASATLRPSRAATSCASAVRARLLALVVGALGHVAGRAQGLGPLEGVARLLDQPRLGLHDGAPGLGDGGRGARQGGVVLGQLGVERVGDEPRQHVALLHAHALVGQHLGDAQALDLGPDQDLLARHQRAGGQHRLREVGRRDARDRHRRGDAPARCRGGLSRALVSDGPDGRGSGLPTSVSEIIRKQSGEHGADQYLSHDRPCDCSVSRWRVADDPAEGSG